jgi:hypothetical protein
VLGLDAAPLDLGQHAPRRLIQRLLRQIERALVNAEQPRTLRSMKACAASSGVVSPIFIISGWSLEIRVALAKAAVPR